MDGSDHIVDFPGFQTQVPKQDNNKVKVIRSPLSRLQRRAPRPLQLKPAAAAKSGGYNADCSSSSSSSSFGSCYNHMSKDPIPLLSPLVLPSLLESVHGEN